MLGCTQHEDILSVSSSEVLFNVEFLYQVATLPVRVRPIKWGQALGVRPSILGQALGSGLRFTDSRSMSSRMLTLPPCGVNTHRCRDLITNILMDSAMRFASSKNRRIEGLTPLVLAPDRARR